MRTLEFTVPVEYNDRKALHFLRGSAGLSCHLVRQLKTDPEGILRNGAPIRTIDPVKTGDVLTIHLPEDLPTVEPSGDPSVLDLLYEDEDLLVLNKPGDLAVHPTHNHQGDTLANLVAAYFQQQGTPAVFRAVGRLDKGTSGIMLIARNSYVASRLQGTVEKTYYAIVNGHYEGSGTIRTPIYRPYPNKTLRAAGEPDYTVTPEASTPDAACTHWKALRTAGERTLLEIHLETGRTHQIRVHFASLGTPLAGDDMYGAPPLPTLHRQALHCGAVDFVHPVSHQAVHIEENLPEELRLLLDPVETGRYD